MTRIDPGVVSLVAEMRGHERLAAEEPAHCKTHHEERRVIDASPAAITLAMILTTAELGSWRRALELEKSRGADDRVDQMSQALNRLRAMVSRWFINAGVETRNNGQRDAKSPGTFRFVLIAVAGWNESKLKAR